MTQSLPNQAVFSAIQLSLRMRLLSTQGDKASPPSPPSSQASAQAKGESTSASGGKGPIAWLKANKDKLKELAKRYGWFPVATYLGIYVIALTGIYILVKAGAVTGPSPERINNFINNWFIKKAIVGDKVLTVPPGIIDFATAWVLTKTTEPVRLVTTIAIVPAVARRLPPHVLQRFGAKVVEAAQK